MGLDHKVHGGGGGGLAPLNTALTWQMEGRLIPVQHQTVAAVDVATGVVAPGNHVLVFAARSHQRKRMGGKEPMDGEMSCFFKANKGLQNNRNGEIKKQFKNKINCK